MVFPPFVVKLQFTKHFRFFIREDLHQPLVGEILKILKKEISHKIPQEKIVDGT